MPAATLPADTEIGYLFMPYQLEQFDLSNGDTLYVKNDNPSEITILTKSV